MHVGAVLMRDLRCVEARRRVGVRLLGIGLSHFDDGPPESTQLALFETPIVASPDEPVESVKDRALTKALDHIRGRFGAKSILPARLVDGKPSLGPRVEE